MKTLKKLLLILVVAASASSLFSQNVLDGVYLRENTPTRKFIPYAPLRQADVMWSKRIWRVMDLREKLNHPFYYPTKPTNGRKCMIDVIKSSLMEGSLTA